MQSIMYEGRGSPPSFWRNASRTCRQYAAYCSKTRAAPPSGTGSSAQPYTALSARANIIGPIPWP